MKANNLSTVILMGPMSISNIQRSSLYGQSVPINVHFPLQKKIREMKESIVVLEKHKKTHVTTNEWMIKEIIKQTEL